MVDSIPFYKPEIGEEEKEEVLETLGSGWVTTGPKTKDFEEKLQNYLGVDHVVAVSSCTDGLNLSLAALDISEGDEVITTPFTFISTVNVILHQGAKPVLADIDKETMNIDPSKIESKITENTEAILPVDYSGHPCELDRINELADKHDIPVVEDAAHAIGAEYKNKKVGKQSDLVNFSFYATKNITTGEGGAVATNDEGLADKVRLLSMHGMSKDAWKRYSSKGSWYYEVEAPGYKSNMTDIQASLGLHQLDKLETFLARRKEIATHYFDAFSSLQGVTVPPNKKNVRHAWHLYPLRLNLEELRIDRNQFISELEERGIGSSVHFIPVHLHPYYQETFGYERGDFPVTEKTYDRIVSLPLFTQLTDEQIDRVITNVEEIINESR